MTDEQNKVIKALTIDKDLYLRKLALELQLKRINSDDGLGATNYQQSGAIIEHNGNGTENKLVFRIDSKDYIGNELKDINNQLENYTFLKRCIFSFIEDTELYLIATMLYVSYFSLETIADELNCDVKTVSRKKLQIINLIMSFNVL